MPASPSATTACSSPISLLEVVRRFEIPIDTRRRADLSRVTLIQNQILN